MSGSHREVRDIVKTAVWSKVHFINSCSTYRLAVLPFTVETIDDILATSFFLCSSFLFFPLLLLLFSVFHFFLPFFFSVFAFSFFFTSLLSLFFFVFPSLCFLQVSLDRSANLFNVLDERLNIAVAESKT